ncbi:molybdopterin molybdotransferase MoeA [Helicobacter sp. MIT 99-5507]|uniref:molybdopterin molybdotransferase MoeA n=1 Tax=Helicobacter sp. MIT 99-5507 TaxID=152489 RepID=UPI000E1E7433|nr:molybdopterin molybdotransferase MoeA [Helicobacter sp. MIT 99-5507]RDU58516.1 hypothetical protein CQA42_01630 [Helicobacter sp. MIT 99-5507]
MNTLNMPDLSDFFIFIKELEVKQKKEETINLDNALNRILSCDIKSRYNIPRFDNSAMDGYAIKIGFETYKLKDSAFAGDKTNLEIKNNEAIKITTGAKIPKNTQAVIPKECVKLDNNKIILETTPNLNQCIKFKGEDYKSGKVILCSGSLLNAQNIALLASQGINKIKVKKKVKIIIFGSGNEITNINKKLGENQIYDINSYLIKSALSNLNCKIKYGGILSDKEKNIQNKIEKALDKYDIIITSGGVSIGEKDYMHKVLQNINADILLDSTNIKPGRPVIFSKKNNSFILSLPGNPIAAFIQYTLHLPLLIQKFNGSKNLYLKPIIAINKNEFKTSKNTSHIILGYYENGYFQAYNDGKYQGAQIAPLLKSNSFAIIDNKDLIKKDTKIKIIPYTQYLFDEDNNILN